MASIIDYCPIAHAKAVQDLWERNLGATWPLSQRVFLSRTCGRPTYEPGDAVVAIKSRKVVGFAMLEAERTAAEVKPNGSIMAIVVDGPSQRAGLGTAMLTVLEARAKVIGCKSLCFGASSNRFWTAVPENLPPLGAMLAKAGYTVQRDRTVVDLVVPLGSYAMLPQYQTAIDAAGVTIGPCRNEDVGAVVTFENGEFYGWTPNLLSMLAAGDTENVIVVRHGQEIVGTTMSFTPSSRWRAANLVWERTYGASMGGYGAVGVAAAWRGKGLGAAMCQAAALHVQSRGGTCCYIDWTGIGPFYEKLGAKVCGRFYAATKSL